MYLGIEWGWGGWVGGLTLDFRPTLPVVTISLNSFDNFHHHP